MYRTGTYSSTGLQVIRAGEACTVRVGRSWSLVQAQTLVGSGGSRKKYLGGLAPHHLGSNHG